MRRLLLGSLIFVASCVVVYSLAMQEHPTWVRPEIRGTVSLAGSEIVQGTSVELQVIDSDDNLLSILVDSSGKFSLPAKNEMRPSYWGDTCLACEIKCSASRYKNAVTQVAICDGELVGTLPVPVRVLRINLYPDHAYGDSKIEVSIGSLEND